MKTRIRWRTSSTCDMPRFSCRWTAIILGLFAILWGTAWAIIDDQGPFAQDVDSWAIKITNTYPDRMAVAELVRDPSLWKGPIIPTVYYAAYIVYPSLYTPIALNILCLGLAVGLLHRILIHADFHPTAVTLAILLWIVYPSYRYLFPFYFAEHVVSLLSVLLFGLVVLKPKQAFAAGLLAGILLLARPPFLFVIAAIPIILFIQGQSRRAIIFAIGAAITFLPWGIRNYFVTGTYIPFTVEGGQTLFHGSYLPIDEIRWQVFKEDPVVAPLEQAAPKDPVERMKYLGGLAKQQVLADPAGQAIRSIRKGMRFWMDVPPDTFVPRWKTGVPMAILLPLAVFGAIRNRRLPVVTWCVVWILGLWALHAAVFGFIRYSVPVFPFMAVLAASTIWRGRPVPIQPA